MSPPRRRDLPLRKAGRWEQKTTMEEGGKKHEQTLTICIDARHGAQHRAGQ